jgi:hypothetical protein
MVPQLGLDMFHCIYRGQILSFSFMGHNFQNYYRDHLCENILIYMYFMFI